MAAHALTSHAVIAFRFLGPVTLEALVERMGPARTEFLRKSLRAPTAFYFSLQLTHLACLVTALICLFAWGPRLPIPGMELRLAPTGHWLNDLVLVAGCFVGLAILGVLGPVALTRLLGVDRLRFMERVLPLMRLVHLVLGPLSRLLARWADDESDDEEEPGDEELEAYIDVGEREGILEEGEGELLRNVVEFGDTRVREVMTPRTDLIGIPSTSSVSDVAELMASTRHSRIPVYEGQLDEIIGLVSLKDVVRAVLSGDGSQPVTSLMKPSFIVPETKRVAELLRELQEQHMQVALVIDEYGGTAGLATVEDLLEEIVGEIREEHEKAEDDVVPRPEGGWLVRGKANVHDLAESLEADLSPDEDTSSVAGLLLSLFDRVPGPGEWIVHAGYRFEVTEADPRRVKRVLIMPWQGEDQLAGQERP